jgi:hypothetical protein
MKLSHSFSSHSLAFHYSPLTTKQMAKGAVLVLALVGAGLLRSVGSGDNQVSFACTDQPAAADSQLASYLASSKHAVACRAANQFHRHNKWLHSESSCRLIVADCFELSLCQK